MIVFAADEPVTVSAELKAVASRFSKLATLTTVARGLVRSGRDAKLTAVDAAGSRQHQRVATRAAVDRRLGAAIGDGVVAAAGVDRRRRRRRRRSCRCRNRR